MPRKRRRGRGEGACFFNEVKGWWVGRVVIGRKPSGAPRHKEVTGKTKDKVLTRMRELENDLANGRQVSDKPLTLSQWLDHWLEHSAKPSVAPATYRSYERCVRLHLKPHLGGYRLTELRPTHVERFFSQRVSAGMSAGNVKKVSEVLSVALLHATRLEYIPVSPAGPVPKPRSRSEGVVVFTDQEVRAILKAARRLRLHALIALAFATGAREGELLALGWQHVELSAESATIHFTRSLDYDKDRGGFYFKEPKSDRGTRRVELPRFATEALTLHRKAMLKEGNMSATVFCTRAGTPIGKSNFVRQVWTQLLKAAGVAYRKFHAARHTHASRLLTDGVPVPQVARRLGDTQETILRAYSHHIPGTGPDVARKLDGFYAGNRQSGVKVESANA
jgi:integrase